MKSSSEAPKSTPQARRGGLESGYIEGEEGARGLEGRGDVVAQRLMLRKAKKAKEALKASHLGDCWAVAVQAKKAKEALKVGG